MILAELNDTEFSDFVAHEPCGNFMQSAERRRLRESMGYHAACLGLKESDKIIAAGLLVEKNHEAWLQLGPILDWDNLNLVERFIKGIMEYCNAHHICELEIYPPVLLSIRDCDGNRLESFDRTKLFDLFKRLGFTHMGFTEKLDFKALRWMFIKDLTGLATPRDIELTFNSSTRKKYHQTLRALDIHVLSDKAELSEWLEPLRESNEKNGIKTRSLKYFEQLWDAFGDSASFVEARLKDSGEVVSSELDIWTPQESVAFLAGTKTDLKKHNGITLIKGWQLEECLRRGQTRANFYGVDGIFTADNPLLRAKSGFRGNVEEYVGGFKIVLRPTSYYLGKVKRKLRI